MSEPDFYKLYCAEVRYKQMLEGRIAELEGYNVGLANEVVELQAHVERLREALDTLNSDYAEVGKDFDGRCGFYREDINEYRSVTVDQILNQTPAQSLNEIKAAAIEEAVIMCRVKTLDGYICRVEALREYQEQLRGEEC